MNKIVVIITILMGLWTGSMAQNPDAKAEPPTEEYEGLVPVLGYLGDKLVGELKTRLNLKEEQSSIEKVATRVKLRVGSLKVDKTVMREVKD
jgi:hypothetical protein